MIEGFIGEKVCRENSDKSLGIHQILSKCLLHYTDNNICMYHNSYFHSYSIQAVSGVSSWL